MVAVFVLVVVLVAIHPSLIIGRGRKGKRGTPGKKLADVKE